MLRQIDLERGHEPHVFVVHLEALLVYELYTETNKWLLACIEDTTSLQKTTEIGTRKKPKTITSSNSNVT